METNQSERKENIDSAPIVPIIDIVRHGETDYKELSEGFVLPVDDPEFALDAEHLDLNAQGIKNIRDTGRTLSEVIDREREIVLIISSPQQRAISTALVMEDELRNSGISMINSEAETWSERVRNLKESRLGLGQIELRDKSFGPEWLQAHKDYGVTHPDAKNLPPETVHRLVAGDMDTDLADIFSETHGDVDKKFRRFLRHMINIGDYLKPEVKDQIKGKRLRIIAITHEERLFKTAEDALGIAEAVQKGQVLEFIPEGRLSAGGEIQAGVCLYGKNGRPDQKSNVKVKFTRSSGLSIASNDLSYKH